MATRGRASPALEQLHPEVWVGTLPVRIAGARGPRPGCQAEGGAFLEYLKGDAVAVGGLFRLCFQGRRGRPRGNR